MENYEFKIYPARRKPKRTREEIIAKRDPLAIRFGTNLSILRELNNENNNHLAKVWNLSKVSISLYEHGLNTPSLEIIETVSKYYDITIDMLMHSEPAELRRFIEKRRTPNPLVRLNQKLHSLE